MFNVFVYNIHEADSSSFTQTYYIVLINIILCVPEELSAIFCDPFMFKSMKNIIKRVKLLSVR